MSQKFSALLWDLDGTILDSGPGIFDSFRKTFAAMGMPEPTPEQLRSFVGPPLMATFNTILGLSPEDAQSAFEHYRGFYNSGGALNARLFDGVLDAVAEARAAGMTNSLATSKAINGVRLVGEHFDFLNHFDFLGTADPAAGRHSKAEVVEYALWGLAARGVDTSRVLLIGDRIHDVEGAREHGIEVALVQWGYGDQTEWEQADYQVADVAGLRRLLHC
jgi:phosphoglycolate phosphatase